MIDVLTLRVEVHALGSSAEATRLLEITTSAMSKHEDSKIRMQVHLSFPRLNHTILFLDDGPPYLVSAAWLALTKPRISPGVGPS